MATLRYLWTSLLLGVCACGGSSGNAPTPTAIEPPASTVEVLPASVLEAWKPFFQERFGAQPKSSLVLDIYGDGRDALIASMEDAVLVFGDVSVETPTDWSTIELGHQQAAFAVSPREWAAERLPKQAQHIAGEVLSIGDDGAPLIVYFDRENLALAWEQAWPAELIGWRRDAEQRLPNAFSHKANNLFSDKRFEATDLQAVFVGDFAADGQLEVALVDTPNKALWHYHGGNPKPTRHLVDFPAGLGTVHKNKSATLPRFPDDDATESQFVELRGDFITLEVPESSSIYLDFADGKWRVTQRSD